MSITLHPWVHPKTLQTRLYVNGLTGQDRKIHKLYLTQGATYPHYIETIEGATPAMAMEFGAWVLNHVPDSWDYWLKLAAQEPGKTPTPTPTPSPASSFYFVEAWAEFERATIIHVAPAVRAGGVQFKNGHLNKAQMIEAIMKRDRASIEAALAHLRALQEGKTPPVQPAPSKTPDNPFGLDDLTELDFAPAPTPALVQNLDLSEYVKRPELVGMAKRFNADIDAAQSNITGLASRVDAIEKMRPVELHYPELPAPVKLEGLHHPAFIDALDAIRAGVHVMLVGPAGSGKTYAAEKIAEALSRPYHKQPPVNYAHEILGFFDAHNRYQRTATREAVEHGGILNLDEFDASSADAGLACNQVADSSRFVAFPDGMVAKNDSFAIVCGVNTDGSGATMQYTGRARLDGATLNRFALIRWDYDSRLEDQLGSSCPSWVAAVRAVREFAHKRGILDVVATMRDIETGRRLLAGNLSRAKVLSMTQRRGALVECWAEVESLPSVRSFLQGA